MIVKDGDRIKDLRPQLKGGDGVISIFYLTTKETLPKKLRLLAEFVVKPGDSIGSHAHDNETEIYFVLSGEGSILDNGELVKISAGDTTITDGAKPHSIKNDGFDDLRFIAVIVLN